MKIDIPERLYFKILQNCNKIDITPERFIEGLFEKHMNLEVAFENYTQNEVDMFTQTLHRTLDELVESQYDLVNSDEVAEYDKEMIDVLKVLFARATRDKSIIMECIDVFYNKK